MKPRACTTRCLSGLLADRRGVVAVWIAAMAPVLTMALGLGIEISRWSTIQVDVQRAADTAAAAGALYYTWCQNNYNTTSGLPTACNSTNLNQNTAKYAAHMAEINGAVGGTGSWASGTNTYTDNMITAQVVLNSGVRVGTDPMVKVSVQQSVPLLLAGMFHSLQTVTVPASAWTEISLSTTPATLSSTGPQPCMMATKTAAQGGTGITTSGSAAVNAGGGPSGCGVRSNAGVTMTGSGSWSTGGIYAAGTISIPFWVDINNQVEGTYNGTMTNPYLFQNAGTIADPYASNTALAAVFAQAALTNGPSIMCSNQNCGLPSASGATFNGSYCTGQGTSAVTCTLKPGYYSNFAATGGGPYTYDLQPGLYIFNGNIDLTNFTNINATNVTMITTGTFTGANTFNFDITAPTPAAAAATGGIAGLAVAGNASDPSGGSVATVSGNPQMVVNGVMYFPNGTFNGSGSTSTTSPTCFELIAGSITVSGNTNFSGTCSSLGAATFGSQTVTIPGQTTYTMQLVK